MGGRFIDWISKTEQSIDQGIWYHCTIQATQCQSGIQFVRTGRTSLLWRWHYPKSWIQLQSWVVNELRYSILQFLLEGSWVTISWYNYQNYANHAPYYSSRRQLKKKQSFGALSCGVRPYSYHNRGLFIICQYSHISWSCNSIV